MTDLVTNSSLDYKRIPFDCKQTVIKYLKLAVMAKWQTRWLQEASVRKDVWVQLPLAAQTHINNGQLAQLVERFIYTEDVGGSRVPHCPPK